MQPTGFTNPNQYHVQGPDLSLSYFPDGAGPGIDGRGRLRFVYQDSLHALAFYGDEVRTVAVPDLGTFVSVTVVLTVDIGSTSFSLLIPEVVLPAGDGASAAVVTEGVTTVHRAFVGAIGHPQREVYSTVPLQGAASNGPLPL